MAETTVVNTKVLKFPKPDDVVFIGRPTMWGNPFIVGLHGPRERCVQRYREWIMTQPQLLAKIHTLRGKKLLCFCAPLACHGDVLAELANALPA